MKLTSLYVKLCGYFRVYTNTRTNPHAQAHTPAACSDPVYVCRYFRAYTHTHNHTRTTTHTCRGFRSSICGSILPHIHTHTQKNTPTNTHPQTHAHKHTPTKIHTCRVFTGKLEMVYTPLKVVVCTPQAGPLICRSATVRDSF